MRRSRRRLAFAGTIAVAACIAAGEARGLTVFDPLNYEQNLLTAARTLESLQNQVRQLQGQAQQLLRMDLNLQPLSGGIGGDLQSTLTQLRARIGEGDALALKVRETDAAFERLYPKTFADALTQRRAGARGEEPLGGSARGLPARCPAAGPGQRDDRRRRTPARAACCCARNRRSAPCRWRRPATSLPPSTSNRRCSCRRCWPCSIAPIPQTGCAASSPRRKRRQRFRSFVGNGRAYSPGR